MHPIRPRHHDVTAKATRESCHSCVASNKNGGKQASLRNVVTSCAELQLAAVAQGQVGNNNNNSRQQNCVAVHLLNQRLNKVLQHCGGPLSAAMFSSSFLPPKDTAPFVRRGSLEWENQSWQSNPIDAVVELADPLTLRTRASLQLF